jgi:hypothetical protein
MAISLSPLPVMPKKALKKRTKMLKPSQIITKTREWIDLGGELGNSIGLVELGTKIFITGKSYSGKSSLLVKLCAAVAPHMKVDYNSLEEKGGDASTMIQKLIHAGVDHKFDDKIRFYKAPLVSEHEETFADILNKKNSAGFAVLDSIQHAGMNKRLYIDFSDRFCNAKRKKIIAFVSHWRKNDFVDHVRHDCDVKLEAMNYVVYVESRLPNATNKPIVIYEEGAKRTWGKNYKKVIEGKYWPGKIK